VVDLLEGRVLHRVAVAHADPSRDHLLGGGQRRELDGGDRDPLVRVIASASPLLVSDPDEALRIVAVEPRGNSVADLRPHSTLAVPIRVHSDALGVLVLALGQAGRAVVPFNLWIAEDLAYRIAFAVENHHLFQKAQQAIRAREEILALVSHDLRSPLSAIAMTTELLADASTQPEAVQRRWAELIKRSVAGMTHLIDDLLDAASIDRGGFSIVPAPVTAEALVAEACEMLSPMAARKELDLSGGVDPAAGAVLADGQQIVRVLSNLIGNAIKFTPAGGSIRVTAEPSAEGIRFTVADTGPGIPTDQVPHVFDRYWRAESGGTRGAGLGLAIAKGIVEMHAGRIWVETEPGTGTRLCFTLPAVKGQVPTPGPPVNR
jgi:signal transduction histidine kinase